MLDEEESKARDLAIEGRARKWLGQAFEQVKDPSSLPGHENPRGARPEICFEEWAPIPAEYPANIPVGQAGFRLVNDGITAHEISIERFEVGRSVWAAGDTIQRMPEKERGFALVWLEGYPPLDPSGRKFDLRLAMREAAASREGIGLGGPAYSVKVAVSYRDSRNIWYRSTAYLVYIASQDRLRFEATTHELLGSCRVLPEEPKACVVGKRQWDLRETRNMFRTEGIAAFEEGRRAAAEKIRLALNSTGAPLARTEFWESRQTEFERYEPGNTNLIAHWDASEGWVLWLSKSPDIISVPEDCRATFNVLARKALAGVPGLSALDLEPWQAWLEFMHYRGWRFEVTNIIPGRVERAWNSVVENGRTVFQARDEGKYATAEFEKWHFGLLLTRVFHACALICLELSAGSREDSDAEAAAGGRKIGVVDAVCGPVKQRVDVGKINAWITDQGYENKTLAEKLKVSTRAISSIRNSGPFHGMKAMVRLANAMGCDVSELYLPPEAST